MSGAWAAWVPASALRAAARLRLEPGLEGRASEGGLWLRGEAPLTGPAARQLRALPGAERFARIAGERLVPEGRRAPTRRLPGDGWRPLAAALSLESQPAAFAGALPEPVRGQLVRDEEGERPAALLRLPFAELLRWGLAAPALRLRPLRFAANDRGEALVWGAPLPPLPGLRYALAGRIATPLGLRIAPALDAGVWELQLGLAPGELAIWDEEGTLRLSPSCWQPLSHGALRATEGRDG